jgi:polyvinyl alcohol dehydrogenase (cytochrome)
VRASFAIALVLAALWPASAAADWPVYGHDLANSRDGGQEGPTPAQIPTLKQAWSFTSQSGDFTGTPAVAAGVLVAGDFSGTVYALDAVTGKVRWSKNLGEPINGSAAIDTAAPGGATVFVPLAHVGGPRLAALALSDGHVRWNTELTNQPKSSVYGSPTFWNGTVYIGTSGPNGDDSSARGTVVALNEGTGAVRWRTFTVPENRDGGPVWSTPAIDTATGRLYVGAGNAYHGTAADTTDAILALDASTGAILGHYQAVAGDAFAADNPAGPDADFGASPNLFTAPNGTAVVGEGGKDGVYYTLDRSTMQLVWKATVGTPAPTGGFLGSTVFDGARIYGVDVATGKVAALNRDGNSAWTSIDGGAPQFAPVAAGHGVLYTVSPGGMLNARDSASGMVLNKFSLGGPSFGGVSVTGQAVYVSVGTGPPPSPAPQQAGSGSIIAFGDTSKSGVKPGPNPGPRPTRPRIRLSVKPRRTVAGRRTSFRFTARAMGEVLPGARVRFAGHSKRTNSHGVASMTLRLRHTGKRVARATRTGFRAGTAAVQVTRKRSEEVRDRA